MKQIAIIAPTASGKTALSIEVAHKTNSIILSLDSLAIYKEIDIASAKPTMKERDGIVHFGIDEIYPDEKFDVMKFIDIYFQAKEYAQKHNKNIIIVGGTGFYLKVLIDGISETPKIDHEIELKVAHILCDTNEAYKLLDEVDPKFAKTIKSNDKYRIEKALCLYFQTNQIPSIYYEEHQPKPFINDITLYEIDWPVEELRKRIELRTELMIQDGLIDEAIFLEKKYGRAIAPMGSIGLKEAFDYLDGKLDKKELKEKIVIATAGLAKRQRTFNKGQFSNIIKSDLQTLKNNILHNYTI
jgi:tRNA dimethylallyltransferase